MACERGKLVPASDGLVSRCVGPWSRDKLFYLGRYLELFSTAMHLRFPERHYIDLFAGPGRCVLEDGSEEIDGSPLLALKVPHRFTKYHFVEVDPGAMSALKNRVARLDAETLSHYYPGDANEIVNEVASALPENALSVVVVDPTGLHLRFEALRRLVEGRRLDLLYVFWEGSIKRNLPKFLRQSVSPLDQMLGTGEWRRKFRRGLRVTDTESLEQEWENAGLPILEIFRKQLAALGYKRVKLGSEILVRNTRNVPLYYLVYASKHSLGHKFWEIIKATGPSGQMGLSLF